MGPSLRDTSYARPATRDRPATRGEGENSLVVPSRTSSLHSRITQPIPSTLNVKPAAQRTLKTLTHAYMVCGVGREPSQWVKAPAPAQGKIGHMKGAVGQFWLPEILGSSPRLEQDNEIARSLHSAMRACFPHDVEICTGKSQPHCGHHAFVLQQDSSHTLYGIALRVWSRADEKRAETIRELRKKTEADFYDNPDETYWIPYCLSFLSRYPLYDLLGDYLRGMWIHWNKATNLFHAEEDYALCYQFPSSPTGFQNFAMWPLFNCLSIPNIVGVMEAAVSPTRRIIFVSHYPAMLTVAAETIRYCVRVYEWSGLYVPVVHARHVKDLVQEPGPYILGVTAECRTLFNAPSDALVVDLDRNFVLTSSPPDVLTQGQRTKFITRLTQALNGDVTPSGVPNHLRSAYAGGKLIPAGQIIVMRGEVESIQEPEWWNQDAVMSVMDHVCEKLGRNTGMKAIFGGAVKKPLMTKVSMRHLNEIVRERNQYSRDAQEAWQDFINLKGRMDTELSKVTKRNNFLVEELETWKQQFLKFQAFAEQLTKETTELKNKIENHKRENRRLTALIDQQKDDVARLTLRLSGTEKQRDDALEALVLQQEIAEELERERKRNHKELGALEHTNSTLTRERDDAQRVVLHLRSLINGKSHHMEHIVRSIGNSSEISESIEQGYEDGVVEATEKKEDAGKGKHKSSVNTMTPALEQHMLNTYKDRKIARLSVNDVADRYLREKTDAIAEIIRSISDQCAAAVEGLHLAQNAEDDEAEHKDHNLEPHLVSDYESTMDGRTTRAPSELSDLDNHSLHPDNRASTSIPPTPDLIHNRSSTSMSNMSNSTYPERSSQQYTTGEIPTRIVEDDDEHAHEVESQHTETGNLSKQASEDLMRPQTSRVIS
ncbi:hypothetical protein N7470_003343 [Penicillium chermesinum]|nr:hypothetical protein N7470_003343 [Penicillium chermesinum]